VQPIHYELRSEDLASNEVIGKRWGLEMEGEKETLVSMVGKWERGGGVGGAKGCFNPRTTQAKPLLNEMGPDCENRNREG